MSQKPIAVSEGQAERSRLSCTPTPPPSTLLSDSLAVSDTNITTTTAAAAATSHATRAAAAGGGAAAVKASRESRTDSVAASLSASLQDGAVVSTAPNAHPHSSSNVAGGRDAARASEGHVEDTIPVHSGAAVVAAAAAAAAAADRSSSLEPSAPPSRAQGPLSERNGAAQPAAATDESAAVHLLQHMQQLLQAGISADMLQQWVSGQLQQATTTASGDSLLSNQPSIDTTSLPPPTTSEGSNTNSGTGASGDVLVVQSNPRRPGFAVSFSLVSTYPAAHVHGEKTSAYLFAPTTTPTTPELAMSDEDTSLIPTPPSLPPQSPSSVAAARLSGGRRTTPSPPLSSVENAALHDGGRATPAGFGDATAASGSKLPGAGAGVSCLMPATPPRGNGLLPKTVPPGASGMLRHQLVDSSTYSAPHSGATNADGGEGGGGSATRPAAHSPGAAGRRGSLNVVYPAPHATSPLAVGSSGGLLKTSRTHTPHSQSQPQPQQWRSFPRTSNTSDQTAPRHGAHQAALTSPVKPVPSHNVSNFPPSTATSARRAQESTLHEVTKAAFRATTSRLVADEQRNISLLLGERFSRKPESMVRRLATPPSAVSTALPVVAAPSPPPEGGRHTSSGSVGDSCLPSALYTRAESTATTPQARSPTLSKSGTGVTTSVDIDFHAADPAGSRTLPYQSQCPPYVAAAVLEDALVGELHRRSSDPLGEENYGCVAGTLAPTLSGRSTPVDVSTASNSTTAATPDTTPSTSLAPSSGGGDTGSGRVKARRDSAVSLLHPFGVGGRRQRGSQLSSDGAPTLPNSVPGTAGTLTCEHDALFPQHSPLVSPSTSPMVDVATHGKMPPETQHSFSSPSNLGVTAPSTISDPALSAAVPLTTVEEVDVSSPMVSAAKRATLANVIPLIEVVGQGEDGSSITTTTAGDSNNTSANRIGALAAVIEVPAKVVPRTWGGAESAAVAPPPTTANIHHHHHPHHNSNNVSTLPPVNTSVTSFAWMPPSSTTPTATAKATESSPLARVTAGGVSSGQQLGHQRNGQGYGRVASFVSNGSSLLGGNAGLGGAGGGGGLVSNLASSSNGANGASNSISGVGREQANGHANNAEGRSFLSLGDDMQSFNSSRVSCVSGTRDGNRDGMHTAGIGNNRLRRTSVLHLSHTSINGGLDPLMDGVMPDFVLDGASGANRRPGPRFLRTYCRHTPVRVAESVTRNALSELEVPYLTNIDEAANPRNVLHLMADYNYTDARAFYVVLCLNILLRYNLVLRFAWDRKKLKRFLEVAATFFRDGNPFHHPVHAGDVLLGSHQWLCEGTTAASLSDREVAAFLLSSLSLHLAHTGVDNRLMTQLRHPYAMLCSYTSPQQGTIVALLMALLRYPELHFFPDPSTAAVNVAAEAPKDTAPAGVSHEWTAGRETQLYDMLSDLIMATDARNHNALRQNAARMAEENAQRHGCLCAGANHSKSTTPPPGTGATRGRVSSATPKEARGDGNSSSSRLNNLSLSTPLPLNGSTSTANSVPEYVCQNCCAYVTENHVPDLLKAVLHYLGFPFLYRSYEKYITGSLMYVAEMYRQSEVEYKILQDQQQQLEEQQLLGEQQLQLQQQMVHEQHQLQQQQQQGHGGGSEQGSSTSLDSRGVRSVAKSAVTRDFSHDTELCNSTETFATAVLQERHPWRQDFTYTSTVASFQRRHSNDPPTSAPASRRSTVATLDRSLFTASVLSPASPPPPPRITEVASANPRSGSDDMTSTDTAAPQQHPAKRPSRVCPLKGHGRDIFLIGVEDVSLPFVEVFAPYLPEAWVRSTYLNHQTCMVALPPAEDYDAAVNRILDLAEETEEGILERQEMHEAAGESLELIYSVPWLQLRRICPSNAEWSVNKDGLVRRVIREVVLGTERLLDQCDM